MGRTNNKVQLTWLTWSLCATYLKVINYVPLSYLKIRERIFLCHFLLEWIDSKEIMSTDASVKMGQWCCFSIFSWHYCVCFSLVLRNPMTPPWTFPVQLIHALPWIKCDLSLQAYDGASMTPKSYINGLFQVPSSLFLSQKFWFLQRKCQFYHLVSTNPESWLDKNKKEIFPEEKEC